MSGIMTDTYKAEKLKESYEESSEIELRNWQAARGRPASTSVRIEQEIKFILNKYQSYVNVLDLGCGGGQFLEWSTAFVSGRFVGVDFANGVIEVAKSNVSAEFYIEDILEFLRNQDDNSFDLIVSLGVIQHILDKKKVANIYKNLSRVSSRFILIANYGYYKNEEELETFMPVLAYKEKHKCLFARRQGRVLFTKELLSKVGERFELRELITTPKYYSNIILLEKKDEEIGSSCS